MSLRSEFEEAGVEYAARLDQQQEAERLAALKLEARHNDNAAAFATALEQAFTTPSDDTEEN